MEQMSNPREVKKKTEEGQMREVGSNSTSILLHAHDANVHVWDNNDDHHAHDAHIHDDDDDGHGHDDGDGGRGGQWGRGCVCVREEDFDEVEGCIDLGFSFPPGHMQRLRGVLPALDACYAVATHNPDSILRSPTEGSTPQSPVSPSAPPTPDEMRVKLRHWARAVACTVRQSH